MRRFHLKVVGTSSDGATFQVVQSGLGIASFKEVTRWDYLIIGDGSYTKSSAGFALASYGT